MAWFDDFALGSAKAPVPVPVKTGTDGTCSIFLKHTNLDLGPTYSNSISKTVTQTVTNYGTLEIKRLYASSTDWTQGDGTVIVRSSATEISTDGTSWKSLGVRQIAAEGLQPASEADVHFSFNL